MSRWRIIDGPNARETRQGVQYDGELLYVIVENVNDPAQRSILDIRLDRRVKQTANLPDDARAAVDGDWHAALARVLDNRELPELVEVTPSGVHNVAQ